MTSCALGGVGDYRGYRKMKGLKFKDSDDLRYWNETFCIVERRELEVLEF